MPMHKMLLDFNDIIYTAHMDWILRMLPQAPHK
jgi:hypothetical protein